MSTPFDELTAKARLTPTTPYTQADIDAAESRLIARLAGNPLPHATSTPHSGYRQRCKSAAGSLRILCEAALTRPGSLNDLNAFISQSMPEPAGARVLGSILHLAASYDSARSWWQYAAGAGDPAAYCLYLCTTSPRERTTKPPCGTNRSMPPHPPAAAPLRPAVFT